MESLTPGFRDPGGLITYLHGISNNPYPEPKQPNSFY